MSKENKEIYEFGNYRLDVGDHLLERSDGMPVAAIPEKAFQTLVYLVRNQGRLVTKDELLDSVWPDAIVEENNLGKAIHAIRRALKESPGEKVFVQTVPKHGYRFIADVSHVNGSNGASHVHTNGNGVGHRTIDPMAPELVPVPQISVDPRSPASETIDPLPASSAKRKILMVMALAGLVVAVVGAGYYFSEKQAIGGGTIQIAILPFKPIDTASRSETFELGMAESLINQLGVVKGLVVRPLYATRDYADIAQDPIAAGKEQRVDFVLASNYQMVDGKVRVTSQLYNVATGQIEESYKSEGSGDFFATQDAVVDNLSSKLLTRFSLDRNAGVAGRGTNNEEAYLFYLQASAMTARRSPGTAKKAIEAFEDAIRLDPNFARAYAGMASAYSASGTLGGGEPEGEFEKAKALVAKALELDGNLAEAYAVRADLKHKYEWDREGSERDFLRAIELEPNNLRANDTYGTLLMTSGRFDEAFTQMQKALTLNPGSLALQRDVGRLAYFARRYDEAITQLKRVIELDEKFQTAYGWLWFALELKGDQAGAYEWFMKHQQLRDPGSVETLRKAYEAGGWTAVKWERLEMNKRAGDDFNTNLYGTARLCAMLGEKDEAFVYLSKAIERRQSQVIMLKVDPAFDPLRDDPRFEQMLKKVGH